MQYLLQNLESIAILIEKIQNVAISIAKYQSIAILCNTIGTTPAQMNPYMGYLYPLYQLQKTTHPPPINKRSPYRPT